MYISHFLGHRNNLIIVVLMSFICITFILRKSESLFHYSLYCVVFVVMKLPVLQKFYQTISYNSSPCVGFMTVYDLKSHK